LEKQDKIIKKYYLNKGINSIINDFDNIVINFSGGKDSLAMLLVMNDVITKDKKFIIKTIHNFLEYDLKVYIEYILNYIINGREFELQYIVYDKETINKKTDRLIQESKKYGCPIYIRYCQQITKYNVLNKQNKKEFNLICNGVRRKESIGRSRYPEININKNNIEYRPIINFTEKEVYDIIKKYDVPLHWLYIYLSRLSCVLCPLSKKNNFKKYIYLMYKINTDNISIYEKWYLSFRNYNNIKSIPCRKITSDRYKWFLSYKDVEFNLKKRDCVKDHKFWKNNKIFNYDEFNLI